MGDGNGYDSDGGGVGQVTFVKLPLASNDGVEFDGSSRLEQTISIGQDVATTSNVTFNQVSASSLVIGDNTYNNGSYFLHQM